MGTIPLVRLSLIDGLIFIALLAPGGAICEISPREYLWLGVPIGLLCWLVVGSFVYVRFQLLPIFLPRCPHCHARDGWLRRGQFGKFSYPVACLQCARVVECWFGNRVPPEHQNEFLALRFLWPYQLGFHTLIPRKRAPRVRVGDEQEFLLSRATPLSARTRWERFECCPGPSPTEKGWAREISELPGLVLRCLPGEWIVDSADGTFTARFRDSHVALKARPDSDLQSGALAAVAITKLLQTVRVRLERWSWYSVSEDREEPCNFQV